MRNYQEFSQNPQPQLAKLLKGPGQLLFASWPAYFWGGSLWREGPSAWGRMPVQTDSNPTPNNGGQRTR